MLPDLSVGQWLFLAIGGGIAYAVGLVGLYAVMTYFFGEKVAALSVQIVGIPLWAELIGVWIAACIVVVSIGLGIVVLLIAAFLAVYGICQVVTWPWAYRHRRLFREYIGLDVKLTGNIAWRNSKEQRKIDRKVKEYAVALQDALDRLEMEVRGDVRSELERSVNQAQSNFNYARKAVHECGFWARPSHLDYLPKRRRDRLTRHLKVVSAA